MRPTGLFFCLCCRMPMGLFVAFVVAHGAEVLIELVA